MFPKFDRHTLLFSANSFAAAMLALYIGFALGLPRPYWAMTTAYITANPENTLEAAAAAVCAMGLCGQRAFETITRRSAGSASFRNALIDEIYKLTPQALEAGANYAIM